MKASKHAVTGRALPLGWPQPESEPLAQHGPATGEAPSTGPASSSGQDSSGHGSSGHGSSGQGGDAGHGSDRWVPRPGLALAGAIGAVLILVLVLPRLLLGSASPEDPVREYLDALVAGDAVTVREHLTDPAGASDVALTTEVLSAAEDRIISYTIDALRTDGRQAVVTASLSSGESVQQASFTVRSRAASSFVASTWELLPVAAAEFVVTVPEGVQELLINAVPVAISGQPIRQGMYDQQVLTLRLLPGSYDLELPGRNPRLVPVTEKVSVPVHSGELRRAGAVMGYELSALGHAEVTAQVDEILEECATATTATPPDCPFFAASDSRPGGADVSPASQGTWQVTAPSSYWIERWISASWSIGSDIGQAVFTPAPGADGSAVPPQSIPFLIDGIALLEPSGELSVELSQSVTLSIVACVDVEDGNRTTVTWPIEGESFVVCQDGE